MAKDMLLKEKLSRAFSKKKGVKLSKSNIRQAGDADKRQTVYHMINDKYLCLIWVLLRPHSIQILLI